MSQSARETVLHIAKATGIGGSERHLLDLLPALGEAGHDVRLCLLESPSHPIDALAQGFEDRGVPVSRLSIRGSADVRLVRRLHDVSARAQIVHTHLVHADIHAGMGVRTHRSRLPRLVTTIHSERRGDTLPARLMMRYLSRRFDRCIVISEAARVAAVGRLGFKDGVQIELIHYGVRVGECSDDLPAKRRGLVVHSRLVAGKNVDDVVRAFAALAEPDLTLTIVGDGEHRPLIEHVAQRLGVRSRVTMLGHVDDVWPVLYGGELWISMSETEGFGLALVEAMGAGLATICTDIPAHREVAAGSAVLVPVGDVEAATHALRRLLGDPSHRKKLGEAGSARAAAFSIERMARRTSQVYEAMLSGRSIPD